MTELRDCPEKYLTCGAKCDNPKNKHSTNFRGEEVHAHWVGDSLKSHVWVKVD
jgi:hypothetical protein